MPNPSLDKRLLIAQLSVGNPLDDKAMLHALAEFGYEAIKLSNDEARSNEVSALNSQVPPAYSKPNVWEEVDKTYSKTLKAARIAFREDLEAQTALLLRGRRQQTLSGWLEQTTTFYKTLLANETWLSLLSRFGYTREIVANELKAVEVVANTSNPSQKEIDLPKKRPSLMMIWSSISWIFESPIWEPLPVML
ncbi:MAG: hypothetical protein AAF485_01135 [Chloroflexota bacterium]